MKELYIVLLLALAIGAWLGPEANNAPTITTPPPPVDTVDGREGEYDSLNDSFIYYEDDND